MTLDSPIYARLIQDVLDFGNYRPKSIPVEVTRDLDSRAVTQSRVPNTAVAHNTLLYGSMEKWSVASLLSCLMVRCEHSAMARI